MRGCGTALTQEPLYLLQWVLQEEFHQLGACVEGAGGWVAVVAVLGATGPGVAAAFDGEERDLGSAAGEPDLVNRARRMRRLRPAAAVVGRPEADGRRYDGRGLDARAGPRRVGRIGKGDLVVRRPMKGDQRDGADRRATALGETAGDDGDRGDFVAHLAADAIRHAGSVGEARDVDPP